MGSAPLYDDLRPDVLAFPLHRPAGANDGPQGSKTEADWMIDITGDVEPEFIFYHLNTDVVRL